MKKSIFRYQLLIKGRYKHKTHPLSVILIQVCKDEVTFYRLGGGFEQRLSIADFTACYELMSDEDEAKANTLRPAIAYFDTGEDKGPGHTFQAWPCVANETRWNGWAVPWFTKSTLKLLFDREYLNESGGMDVNKAAVTPVHWVSPSIGIFFDNHIPDWVELCHMFHHGKNYYSIDGYCWDLLEPMDDGVEKMTQTFKFTPTSNITQTDEELCNEFGRWVECIKDRPYVETILLARQLKARSDLTWPQRQYVLNWLYRWENCDDA